MTRTWIAVAICAFATSVRGDENMTGRKELEMQHCPSAVPGAITRVTDIDRGVVVRVSAPLDPIAQQEIRRRVQYQLEIADQVERGAIEHTGVGTGSGRFGYCPGMLQHTSLDVEWTADGAKMVVRTDEVTNVRWLQTTTHKRARTFTAKQRVTAR